MHDQPPDTEGSTMHDHHDTALTSGGANPPAGRFIFTTFRWANQLSQAGEWAKVPLMRRGFAFADFTCGTDTPHQWAPFNPPQAPVQIGLICSPQVHLLAVDVDHPDEFAGTRTAGLLGRDDAMTTRGAGFHIGLDMRGVHPARWPRQGKIAGADIKAAGFVPLPGSVHYSGQLYAPHRVTAGQLPYLVPASDEILAALLADRSACTQVPRAAVPGGSSGGSPILDGEMAAAVLRCVMQGRSEAECYQLWRALAAERQDPAEPFTDADFARHYRNAPAKAARYKAAEAGWFAAIMRRRRGRVS
jgi:hypothetical protein